MSEEQTAQSPSKQKIRKIRTGVVTSDKMQKTRVVRVSRLVKHSMYTRVITRNNSFKVHDENNISHKGDVVSIIETRPLSKDKRWRIISVVNKASSAPPVPQIEDEEVVKIAQAKPERVEIHSDSDKDLDDAAINPDEETNDENV